MVNSRLGSSSQLPGRISEITQMILSLETVQHRQTDTKTTMDTALRAHKRRPQYRRSQQTQIVQSEL
jgi:hypothetical protein